VGEEGLSGIIQSLWRSWKPRPHLLLRPFSGSFHGRSKDVCQRTTWLRTPHDRGWQHAYKGHLDETHRRRGPSLDGALPQGIDSSIVRLCGASGHLVTSTIFHDREPLGDLEPPSSPHKLPQPAPCPSAALSIPLPLDLIQHRVDSRRPCSL